MRFVRTTCGGYLIFFYESFGVHRGLFPKVPYVGVGKAHGFYIVDVTIAFASGSVWISSPTEGIVIDPDAGFLMLIMGVVTVA